MLSSAEHEKFYDLGASLNIITSDFLRECQYQIITVLQNFNVYTWKSKTFQTEIYSKAYTCVCFGFKGQCHFEDS